MDDPGQVTYSRITRGLRAGASILNSIPGLTRIFALVSRTGLASVPSFAMPSFLTENTTVKKRPTGRWILPTGLDPATGFIFYIHGGAYEIGNPGTHELFLRLLVYRTKTAVFAPTYVTDLGIDTMHARLHEAYKDAIETSPVPGIPVLMGDSAGGGLVITFLQYLHQKTRRPYQAFARSIVLISPWVRLDFETETPYDRSKETLDFLPLSMVKRFAHRMCPSVDVCTASADRILGNRSIVFPRTFVLVGGDEVLGKGIVETCEGRLDTVVRTYPGMKHVFPVLGGLYNRVAYDSISDIVRFVRNDMIHVDAFLDEVVDGRVPRTNNSRMTCRFDMRVCCTAQELHIPTYKNTKSCLHKSERYDKENSAYRWKHGARVYWMIDRNIWALHQECMNLTVVLDHNERPIETQKTSLGLSNLEIGSTEGVHVELPSGARCIINIGVHSDLDFIS